MKIKKSKTKIIVLSVCSVLAIIGFLAYRVELYHRTNDPNKERIFEIEDYSHDRKLTPYGTEKDLQYNSESIRAFIIQNCPDNEEKTKALIYEFLNTYNYKNEMENCGTDKIYIDFMKPSWRFPVYWTEKWDMKHTWHRDGSYLANYFESNRVAYVRYNGYWKIMFGKFPVMTSVRDSEKQRLKIFLALGLNEKI